MGEGENLQKVENDFKGLTQIAIVRQLKDVIFNDFIIPKKKYSEIQAYIERVANVVIKTNTLNKYLSKLGFSTRLLSPAKREIPVSRADLLEKRIDELEAEVEQQNKTIAELVKKVFGI